MGILKTKQNKNIIATKIYSKNNINEIDFDLKFYLNLMYKEQADNNYISLLKKFYGRAYRWGINTNELDLLQKFVNENNFYLSVNEFFRPDKATQKYLKRLNAFYIDLDYYNVKELKDLTVEQIIGQIEYDLDYPQPSFYVDSGKGLYIFWLLEKTVATKKSIKYWKMVQSSLISLFESYGADKKVKDATRVLRQVSSKNGKTGRKVKLLLNSGVDDVRRYEISDIAGYLWGYEEKEKTKKKTKSKVKKVKQKDKKIIALKTIQTLHYNRKLDLEKLVEIRKNLKGHREQLLFLYRLQLSMMNFSKEDSLKATLELNSKMTEPLEEEEVINATKSAEDNAEVYLRLKEKFDENLGITLNQYLSMNGVYLYKNSTIIKELDITQSEQKLMKILIGTEEKEIRKKKRNKIYYKENKEYHQKYYQKYYEIKRKSKGKLSRAEQNEIIREKIKSLLNQGFTQKEIALKLDATTRTVRNHIKYMKENGIL